MADAVWPGGRIRLPEGPGLGAVDAAFLQSCPGKRSAGRISGLSRHFVPFAQDETTVYIVDDDPSSRRCCTIISLPMACEKCAYSIPAKSACNIFSRSRMIILDYHLDSVQKSAANGLTILEKIRKHDRNVHIIVPAARPGYAVAAETIAKGAEQYVIKTTRPFRRSTPCCRNSRGKTDTCFRLHQL